jgi:tripartite-type tricarboxylate transporter receptor subunit TctC
MTGIEVVHVPYKGAVLAHTGLIAGEVHVMFDAMTSALPHIRSGRLRCAGGDHGVARQIAAGRTDHRETVPGYEVTSWLGIGAPIGTPREIVERLNKEINAVLAEPAIRSRFAELGSEPLVRSPAEFAKFIAEEADGGAR